MPVLLVSMRPPMPRPQTPPPIAPGGGFAGAPMKALVWFRKAVVEVLSTETSELTEEAAPAAIGSKKTGGIGPTPPPPMLPVHCAWAAEADRASANALP